MTRKSLSITEENDKRVQKIRSKFLGQDEPIDIDYTKMTNILIEIGDLIFINQTITIEDITNIITKYIDIDKDQLKKLLEKK